MAFTKFLRTFLFSVVLLSNFVFAAEQANHTPFYNLLNDGKTLSLLDISQIDFPPARIALYQADDRSSSLTSKTSNTFVESEISERFVKSSRYSVISCIECKTTKIALKDGKLKISQPIESNDDLKLLGEKLGVDAFLFWQVSSINNEEHLSLKLVSADDNRIVWAKQYSYFHYPEKVTASEELYMGLMFVDAKRVDTVANDTVKMDSLSTIGYRYKDESNFNSNLDFSLSIELISSAFNDDAFALIGFALEERLYYNLQELTDVLPMNAYLGIGQIFFEGSHNFFFRTGLSLPLGEVSSIDFGAVYLNDTNISWEEDGNYSQSSDIGGLTTEIILSMKI